MKYIFRLLYRINILLLLSGVSSCQKHLYTEDELVSHADSVVSALSDDECLYIGRAYEKMAADYEAQGRYVNAISMYRKACEIYRNRCDKNNSSHCLQQQEPSSNYRTGALFLICTCLIVVAVFLLKDRLKKNRYLQLQTQLKRLNLSSLPKDSSSKEEDDEVMGIVIEAGEDHFKKQFFAKLDLCLQLYRETDVCRKIQAMERNMQRTEIHMNAVERQKLCDTLYDVFSDLLVELKQQCPALTRQDLLYCVFFVLDCSKYTILLCTSTSDGAFKTRKSRIKDKIGEELFKQIFIDATCENQCVYE